MSIKITVSASFDGEHNPVKSQKEIFIAITKDFDGTKPLHVIGNSESASVGTETKIILDKQDFKFDHSEIFQVLQGLASEAAKIEAEKVDGIEARKTEKAAKLKAKNEETAKKIAEKAKAKEAGAATPQ